jgi:hypothetical protein
MMEAARTSETLVNFYQTTRRYNQEDSHLHTHRRENLKSYVGKVVYDLDINADIPSGQRQNFNLKTHTQNAYMHTLQ